MSDCFADERICGLHRHFVDPYFFYGEGKAVQLRLLPAPQPVPSRNLRRSFQTSTNQLGTYGGSFSTLSPLRAVPSLQFDRGIG